MEQTSLLAISTPATDGAETVNFYSSMMDAQLHGKPMFKTLKVGLACEACIAAGLATSCSHMEVSSVVYLYCFTVHLVSQYIFSTFFCSRFAHPGSRGKCIHIVSLVTTTSLYFILTCSLLNFCYAQLQVRNGP